MCNWNVWCLNRFSVQWKLKYRSLNHHADFIATFIYSWNWFIHFTNLSNTQASHWCIHHTDLFTPLVCSPHGYIHHTGVYTAQIYSPHWCIHRTDIFTTLGIHRTGSFIAQIHSPHWFCHHTDSVTRNRSLHFFIHHIDLFTAFIYLPYLLLNYTRSFAKLIVIHHNDSLTTHLHSPDSFIKLL